MGCVMALVWPARCTRIDADVNRNRRQGFAARVTRLWHYLGIGEETDGTAVGWTDAMGWKEPEHMGIRRGTANAGIWASLGRTLAQTIARPADPQLESLVAAAGMVANAVRGAL